MLRDTENLRALVSRLHVHDSATRKRLNKYGYFGRVARRKLIFSIEYTSVQLRFAKLNLNKTQDFWAMSSGQTKVFGFNTHQTKTLHIRTNTSYQLHTALMVEWWFRLVLQPQYLSTLEWQLKLGWNGLNRTMTPGTSANLKKKKEKRIKMLQRSSQSPDQNCLKCCVLQQTLAL